MNKITNKCIKEANIDSTSLSQKYDHYIALDWSKKNMAIARMTEHSAKAKVTDVPSDLKELKVYLKNLSGTKILAIEESTSTQWLYVELYDYVNKIFICDPYRNKLLSDGPKNDPIDARKLCLLLRNGLLKEVFHSTDKIFELRKYVSAYNDIVKSGVRLKNQHSAFLAREGKDKKCKEKSSSQTTGFIMNVLEESIEQYEKNRKQYWELFGKLCRKEQALKNLQTIPGVGNILAVQILAAVIDAKRFPKAGGYLAYCGLVKHMAVSGGRIYGKRNPRYNRTLKYAYKTAASISIQSSGPIREYYDYLLGKGIAENNARNAVARYIAKASIGILKHNQPFNPYLWRAKKKQIVLADAGSSGDQIKDNKKRKLKKMAIK